MSLQSIEIEAFSGPTSVLIGGGNQPTIVYINQGPAGAAGGTWGSITGTLSSQTDLQDALNLKAPLASPTFTGIVTAPRIEGKCAGLELFCKASQAINAGQVVYVTGSSGTNVIIGLAQADAELTSSKTIGICESTLAHNATGYVITEGLMTVSISAPTAAVGDPIWLSGTTAGGMLFGAANKPAYPYHVVYLGVVTRKTGNTIVEMYVKVQNGFEINELSDVLITTPLANQALVRNSDKWINRYLLSSDISDLAASLALKAPLASPTFTGTVTATGAGARVTASRGTVGVGTVYTDGSLAAIGGTSTDFLSRFVVGDSITFETTKGPETKQITAIHSDTSMTTTGFSWPSASGAEAYTHTTASAVMNPSGAISGTRGTFSGAVSGTVGFFNGMVTVGGTNTWNGSTFSGAQAFTGPVVISDATASTTTTTGALKVAGGLGVVGAINAAAIAGTTGTFSGAVTAPSFSGTAIGTLQVHPTGPTLIGGSAGVWNFNYFGSPRYRVTDTNGFELGSSRAIAWSGTSNDASASKNLFLSHGGSGIIRVGTTLGSTNGEIQLAKLTASGTVTATGNAILPTSTTPASASATGVAGTVCRDADYIYVCTATNTWKRAALSTW